MEPIAIIMAGGKGERLRPFTNDRPKPMVELGGRPILYYQCEWLAREGVREVVIACGFQARVIQNYFADGSEYGLHIQYAVEDAPLGRGGALKFGYRLVRETETIIVAMNGDNITNQPLRPLIEFHRQSGAVATAVVTPLISPFGITEMAADCRITGFVEKPRLPYWQNAGLYALSPVFFSLLPDRGDHEVTTFPALAESGQLYGYKSEAYWRTVNTAKDLAELECEIQCDSRGQRWPPLPGRL